MTAQDQDTPQSPSEPATPPATPTVLELVPIESDAKKLSPEEIERLKRRIKPIPPERLKQFNEDDRLKIKIFLTRLIALSEQINHLMMLKVRPENFDDLLVRLATERTSLFKTPPRSLRSFINLMELCAMEPWQELESFLMSLHGEDQRRYFETKNKAGVKAALDNPFLMAADEDRKEDQRVAHRVGRFTPKEIESYVFRYSLEDIVKHIIIARKINTGQFWDSDHFDL